MNLNEVVNWLESHDIKAEPLVVISNDIDATQLISVAKKYPDDIVITDA